MKLQLTRDLVQFLYSQGYKYCYSRTIIDSEDNICINLVPTVSRPYVRRIPADYDTFFALSREPWQMADGIDENTLVLMSLNKDLAIAYFKQVLRPLLKAPRLSVVK